MKKILLLIIIFIQACGGSSDSNEVKTNQAPAIIQPSNNVNLAVPNNTLVNHYKVLLIGNSHVGSNNLAGMIKLLIEQGKPESEISVDRVSGIRFLDERVDDGVTLEKIISDDWTHVILQAQKYSQSGNGSYPTSAAENWINTVKEQSATPILFPEHPQRDNPSEGNYVHELHLAIAENQSSCVAPIGLAWNLATSTLPDVVLHAPDGNHAAYAGSFLTALVFYQVITGELADALPYIENITLSESIQSQLGSIASQILDEHQACYF